MIWLFVFFYLNVSFFFFSPLSDVNECEFANSSDSLHRNDPCLHRCDNLPGSYRCYCKDGYHLKGDRCEGLKNIMLLCYAAKPYVI